QAASSLDSLDGWWRGLSPTEPSAERERHFTRLVDRAERILEREQGGWIQVVSDALAELQEEQARAAESPAVGGGPGAVDRIEEPHVLDLEDVSPAVEDRS